MKADSHAMLDYEPPKRVHPLLHPFYLCAFIFLCVLGCCVAVSLRGQMAGFCWPIMVIITGITLGPFALLAFIGLPPRRCVWVVAIVVLLPASIADTYGIVEEQLFIRSVRAKPPLSPVVIKPQRWWPNKTAHLIYNQSTGSLDSGD